MNLSVNTIIRVLLVDDHSVMRSGLRLLIESEPGFKVVGEAGSPPDAISAATRTQPDIILLDLDLRSFNGLDLLPDLLAASSESKVLILTGVLDPQAHHRAVQLGAKGLVLKETAPQVLIQAIEKVYQGEIWLNRQMIAELLTQKWELPGKLNPEASKIATLTERERELISLIGEGL
ncbi:MAG: response regulator transcription factor, partial [Pyrinomonadaceae bacterium]